VLDKGLVPLGGPEPLGSDLVSRPTFGSALKERIGLSRRFCFTFARNCSSSARSLEISSELLSSSDVSNLSVGIDGGVVGDDSPDESWSVSSNTSSLSSDQSTGDSASSSIVA